jgi:iron complex transport system permease protein
VTIRPGWLWLGVLTTIVGVGSVALTVGAVPLPLSDVLAALAGRGDPMAVEVVRNLRLPRVLLAAVVGLALGTSGAALQGMLRNALAEPYLLGVSGGAAVGAVTAIVAGVGGNVLLPLMAFAGAAVAVITVLLLARSAGGAGDARTLLLAGVVVGAFANAVIVILLADAPADRVRNVTWWMMGSVADASWSGVGWLVLYVVPTVAVLVALGRALDVLALGEESASGLGTDVRRTSLQVFLLAALLAAASVSAAGLVGFVGLVVPNIVRAAGVTRHRAALPAAGAAGAALLLAADLLARTVRAPVELPLGAITAIIGVPLFLTRLWRGVR